MFFFLYLFFIVAIMFAVILVIQMMKVLTEMSFLREFTARCVLQEDMESYVNTRFNFVSVDKNNS